MRFAGAAAATAAIGFLTIAGVHGFHQGNAGAEPRAVRLEVVLSKDRLLVGDEAWAKVIRHLPDGSTEPAKDLRCDWTYEPELAVMSTSSGCAELALHISASDLAGSVAGKRRLTLGVSASDRSGAGKPEWAHAHIDLFDPDYPVISVTETELGLGGATAVSVQGSAKSGYSCYWTPSANFRDPTLCATVFIAPLSPLGPEGRAAFEMHADVVANGAGGAYDVARTIILRRDPRQL